MAAVKISAEEYLKLTEDYAGYCTACEKVIPEAGIEPDAEDCECPLCEGKFMIGLDNAVVEGNIEVD